MTKLNYKMKIKEVSAGVKMSKNYDSYQMNLVADLEKGESAEKVGEILIERAIEVVNKKMKEDNYLGKNKNKEIEVGAAWFSKKSKEVLSVQYSKNSKWVDVEVKDLERIGEGYKQKINEGVFLFRRIPEEKRKSNKMPVFRIYEVENEK